MTQARVHALITGTSSFVLRLRTLVAAMPNCVPAAAAEADAVFTTGAIPTDADCPVYLFQRADSTRLPELEPLLDSRVRLVRMYHAARAEDYALPAVGGRLHVATLPPEMLNGARVSAGAPPAAGSWFGRLRTGPCFLHMGPCAAARAATCKHGNVPWGERDIDLMFIGTVDRYPNPAGPLSRHRLKVVADLQALAGKYRVVAGAGRIMSREKLLEHTRRARVVVSPWGWGEACHRDYEAVLAGCHVLKPALPYSIASAAGLHTGRHTALVPVPPHDMLATDLAALLHAPPDQSARNAMLLRGSPSWLPTYLRRLIHDDTHK